MQMTPDNLLDAGTHFAFGKNWLDYARKIDEPRIAQAVVDLQRLLGGDLTGKSFLDIGCGSGLHALAAIRLGASRVAGVDIDVDSVTASRATLARFAPSASAEFEVRSVFDLNADDPGIFDVVYSWGVLHHTGDMNRAVTHACTLIAKDGRFVVALYKKTLFCGIWRRIKRWYSRATPEQQAAARQKYIWLKRLASWVKGRDFEAYIRDYGVRRGMDFYNDVHDWMGGYPYESISPQECHDLMRQLGFSLEREFIAPGGGWYPTGLLGSGCDEYVFDRI